MTTPTVLAEVERALTRHFAQPPARASISFVGVEPIEVLRFTGADGTRHYLSLGLSRRPMTAGAEQHLDADGPRAELQLTVRDRLDAYPDVWRCLAVLAAAPVVEAIVHEPGATVDLGAPIAPASRCTGVLLTASAIAAIPTAAGRVDILDATPATATELAWCRVHGSDPLCQRWADQHVDLLDLGRAPATLD